MTLHGLRRWMVLRGLTFHAVATKAGLSGSLLCTAAARGQDRISARTIGRIAAAYGTTPIAMHEEVGELRGAVDSSADAAAILKLAEKFEAAARNLREAAAALAAMSLPQSQEETP